MARCAHPSPASNLEPRETRALFREVPLTGIRPELPGPTLRTQEAGDDLGRGGRAAEERAGDAPRHGQRRDRTMCALIARDHLKTRNDKNLIHGMTLLFWV